MFFVYSVFYGGDHDLQPSQDEIEILESIKEEVKKMCLEFPIPSI